MAEESVLTNDERRLVRWYYVLPSLARRCFYTLFLVGGEFLLLAMLNDLVFHDRDPFVIGWIAMIVDVIALSVVVSWSIAAHNRFNYNKKWAAIKEKARAHAEARGKSWGTRKGPEDGDFLEYSAKRVAQATDVELPDKRAARRTATLLALAFLAAVYAVNYVSLVMDNQSQQEVAAKTVSTIEASLEDAGFYVYGADPLEGHDPDGYSMYARFDSDDSLLETSRTGLVVDNAGQVIEVSYTLVVDPELPLEESLAQAEADLAVLHDAVAALDVPTVAPGLLSYGELPEEFRADYLAGSPDEDVFFHDLELNIADGAEVSCNYTVSIDEGEYLSSSIWLNLEPAE